MASLVEQFGSLTPVLMSFLSAGFKEVSDSFPKCLLRTYIGPGTVLGIEDTLGRKTNKQMNKNKMISASGGHSPVEDTDIKPSPCNWKHCDC